MRPIAPWIAALLIALPATGGEFNERAGAALAGHDPVAYFTDGRPVAGNVLLRHEHRGSVFLFSSEANRSAFAAEPAKFAPQYDGYCAFGVSRGYKADVDPSAFTIVGGKLYLNYNRKVQEDWLKDTAGHIDRADRRWGEVRKSEKVFR